MEYVEVKLDGYPEAWISGKDILDCTVTLGQNEMSSAVEITLADPDNEIANRLIEHSLRTGGIQKLESDVTPVEAVQVPYLPTDATQPKDELGWEVAIVKGCLKYGVTDRNQIAYVLATAWKETTMGADLVNESANKFEGINGNDKPGDAQTYIPRGLVQVTGKANYAKVKQLTNVDVIANPKLMESASVAVPALVLGMQRGIYTGKKLNDYINGFRQDFFNARRIVNGTESAEVIANKAKNTYLAKVPDLITKANASTINVKDKPSVAVPTQGLTDTPSTEPIVKGSKLTVSISQKTFIFYHQSTSTDQEGKTTITGQGIRWAMNRRTRNKTEKQIRLKELAEKIATAHKLTLVYDADINIMYEHIDQTNITDYQLLKRECDRSGLFIGEANGQLTIKSLRNIVESLMEITYGINLISFNIKDTATDTYDDDKQSALLQKDPKLELNPVTGQFEQKRIDIDTVKDTATTGKDKEATTGTIQPGQAAIATLKRVLPQGDLASPVDKAQLAQAMSLVKQSMNSNSTNALVFRRQAKDAIEQYSKVSGGGTIQGNITKTTQDYSQKWSQDAAAIESAAQEAADYLNDLFRSF